MSPDETCAVCGRTILAGERTRSAYYLNSDVFDAESNTWFCVLRLGAQPVGSLALCDGTLTPNDLASRLLGAAKLDSVDFKPQWEPVLFSSLVSAFNALMRYTIHYSSNAWLEIQWYMFGAMFLLAAGYALKHEEHVRVDVFYSQMSPRTQAWVGSSSGNGRTSAFCMITRAQVFHRRMASSFPGIL